MPSISLFDWFAQIISKAWGVAVSGDPISVLNKIKAPLNSYSWLADASDDVFPLIRKSDAEIPDLESRDYIKKRKIGQFYTPEILVDNLYKFTKVVKPNVQVLDPACGDGAFLVRYAVSVAQQTRSNILDYLSGWDIDVQALLVTLGRLIALCPRAGWPNLQKRDFLLSPPTNDFDLVVGNPPYKVNLPEETKEKLKVLYETAEGEKDLFTFFIEGGVKCLKPFGSLLMLTSHTYLVNHQCSKIREFLFKRHCIKALFLLPHNFFAYARGVIPVVLWVEKSYSSDNLMNIFIDYNENTGWNKIIKSHQSTFLSTTGLRTALRDPKTSLQLEKMEHGCIRLGEIARIGVGIQESQKRESVPSRFVHDGPPMPDSVPVLRGREIEPFKINWEGKYLRYGPHLVFKGNPELFKKKKILYQNIRNEALSKRIVAAIDTDGFFPKNSLSYIVDPIAPFTLEYILGIINSDIVNLWFREHYYSFHITVTQMRTIPIPIATPEARQKVEQLVEKIINALKKNQEIDSLIALLNQAVEACFFNQY